MRHWLWRYGKAFAQGLVLSVPIGIAFVDNVACVATVYGSSMKPSFNPDRRSRDIVVLNKWTIRNFKGINRGDVVSIVDPHDPDIILIKRVVAMQGDRVKTVGYKNKYVKIPRGHCWIEGDNSNHSMDSNTFGPVPVGLIQAKATRIIWPIKRWSKVESKLLKGRSPLSSTDITDDVEDKDGVSNVDENEPGQFSLWKPTDVETISECGLVPGKFGPV